MNINTESIREILIKELKAISSKLAVVDEKLYKLSKDEWRLVRDSVLRVDFLIKALDVPESDQAD